MKTPEEIEKLAFEQYPRYITDPYNPVEDGNKEERDIWIEGYNQCQQDNADKKFTLDDIINSIHQAELKHKKNYTEIYELMKTYLQSINK